MQCTACDEQTPFQAPVSGPDLPFTSSCATEIHVFIVPNSSKFSYTCLVNPQYRAYLPVEAALADHHQVFLAKLFPRGDLDHRNSGWGVSLFRCPVRQHVVLGTPLEVRDTLSLQEKESTEAIEHFREPACGTGKKVRVSQPMLNTHLAHGGRAHAIFSQKQCGAGPKDRKARVRGRFCGCASCGKPPKRHGVNIDDTQYIPPSKTSCRASAWTGARRSRSDPCLCAPGTCHRHSSGTATQPHLRRVLH